MNQVELEKWIADHGGAGALQHSEETKEIPNPDAQLMLPDGTKNPKFNPTAPDKITVKQQSWVNAKTGAQMVVTSNPDGTYTSTTNKGGDPAKSGDAVKTPTPQDPDVDEANKRANRQAQALENERTWNEANGGYRETHLERRDREAKDKTAAEAAATKAAAGAKDIVGTRTEKDERTGKTVTVNTHRDNSETRSETTLISKPDKQETVVRDGKTYVIDRDADGKVIGEREVTRTETSKPIPVSATGWTPDLNKPAYGLQERFQEIVRRQALAPTDPDYLTATQAKQLYDQDKAVAEAHLAQAQGITSVQSGLHGQGITQRGQDQGVVNQRLTSGHNATTSALAAAQAGHHGGAATMQLLDLYHKQAERYGGLKDVPREPLPPALARINTLDPFGPGGAPSGAPGVPALPVSPGAPVVPVAPAPALPGVPPSSNWPGRTGSAVAPVMPLLPAAPGTDPLPAALANIPPAAGLPVPATAGLTDSAAGLTVAPIAAPVAPVLPPGFDPRQIAGLDPQAALRQQIIRQHFAGLMGGGF